MRWLEPETTAAPAAEPVTLAEAKVQCRIDVDDAENAAPLAGYVAAARRHIEETRGLRLVEQTVKLRAWGLDESCFRLPLAPISAITGVTYLDAAGDEQALDAALYVTALYGLSPTVALKVGKAWPGHLCQLGAVTFTCTAGYAALACPEPIKQAILLIVGEWNLNREAAAVGAISSETMGCVESLLVNFRGPFV